MEACASRSGSSRATSGAGVSPYRRTQCSTGRSRNDSTGMPSAPTSSFRSGEDRAERLEPRQPAALRPLLTSMAVTCWAARTTKSTSRSPSSRRRARTRPWRRRSRPDRRFHEAAREPEVQPRLLRVRPDCAVSKAVFSTCSFGLEARPARAVTAKFWRPVTIPAARAARGNGPAWWCCPRPGGGQHLLVGKLLAAVPAGQLEQLPQQRRLVHRVSSSTSGEIVVSTRASLT